MHHRLGLNMSYRGIGIPVSWSVFQEMKRLCLVCSGFILDIKKKCVCVCRRAYNVHTRTCMCEREQLADRSLLLPVIILICSSEDARRILQAAEGLGLDSGEFVFVLLQQLEVGVGQRLCSERW